MRIASFAAFGLVALFASACGTSSSTPSVQDASIAIDAGADASTAVDASNADSASPFDAAPPGPDGDPAPVDAARPPDAAPMNECEALQGLCVGQSGECTNGGGTVATAGAAGCVFSDGPGVCCVPPAAQATGSDCRSHGGVCAPIAGCNFAHGNFAPPSCGSYPGVICCVPQSICGEEKLACCTDQTTFRPACDRGTFVCTIAGTTLKPRDQCP